MREMIEEMVDELLDSEGDVVIGNLRFSRSTIVRELDPIAYREICLDFADSQIEDLKYELEVLKDSDISGETYDEVEDLEYRIRQLEGI